MYGIVCEECDHLDYVGVVSSKCLRLYFLLFILIV